jgi:hypothetical protein
MFTLLEKPKNDLLADAICNEAKHEVSRFPLLLFDAQPDFVQTFKHAFDDFFELDVVPD